MRFLLALLFVSSCGIGCELPAAEVPTEQVFSECEKACKNMAELGCDIAEPDEDGTTCVEICDWTQEQGLIDLEPEKLAVATSCDD